MLAPLSFLQRASAGSHCPHTFPPRPPPKLKENQWGIKEAPKRHQSWFSREKTNFDAFMKPFW